MLIGDFMSENTTKQTSHEVRILINKRIKHIQRNLNELSVEELELLAVQLSETTQLIAKKVLV